jgi:hypothetical protein
MRKQLCRQELYDLVWSTPMKTLAAQFGISDVGLKKTCARAAIPTPDRGYWAKREAGKHTVQVTLPKRAPGMNDEVVVAGGSSHWQYGSSEEDLRGPLPSPPEFPEPLDAVHDRIAIAVGKVTVPQKVTSWLPVIAQLLKEDDQRREQHRFELYRTTWNSPRFDSAVERRRLRILNSLFFAVTKMDGKPSISKYEPYCIHVTIFQQKVGITLEQPPQSHSRKQQGTSDATLSLSIRRSINSTESAVAWQDSDETKLEALMAEIAVEVILTAERQYRDSELRRYEWRVKRKAELEEQERQRNIAAEKAAKERQRQIEQARIDRLLKDAAALQQANAIREYVDALRARQDSNAPTPPEEFERWSAWALIQADRIDPAVGGRFTKAMHDAEEVESA